MLLPAKAWQATASGIKDQMLGMPRWAVRGDSPATVTVLATAGGTFAVLQSIVGPALPVMQRALDADQSGATWIMTAYLLSAAILTPVMGRVGDSLGKKRVLIAVLLVLACGTAVSAFSQDITTMIVGRLIQGAGGGAFPLAFGILRDHLNGRQLTKAVGTVASVGAGSAGLGGVLSGIIVDTVGFRWLFLGPMIIILIATVVLTALPASPRSPAPLNAGSVVLFAIWLASLLLVTSQARTWGTTSTPTLAFLILTVAAAVAWTMVERKTKSPLIDLSTMKGNTMWTTGASAALLGVVLYGLQTFLPQYVQTSPASGYGLGLSVFQSGLVLLPMAGGIFFMGVISHRLLDRFGTRKVMVAGPALAAIGMAFLAVPDLHIWKAVTASTLTGVGLGLTLAVMPAMIVAAVPQHQSGVASGINANLRTVGGALGAAVISSIITPFPGQLPSAESYQAGFAVIAAAAVLAALVGIQTRATKKPDLHGAAGTRSINTRPTRSK